MSSYYGVNGFSVVIPDIMPDWNTCIPASMKRRDPRIWHIAYSVSHKVMTDTNVTPRSIIAATALGALDETKNFLDTVFDTGFGNPRHFIASVHNSMAGKIALEKKITGPNLTVCEGQNSLASAIAMLDSLDSESFPALIILIDENIDLLKKLHSSYSSLCKEYLDEQWKDGAVAFILDNKTEGHNLLIRAHAAVPRNGTVEKSLENLANAFEDNERPMPVINICKSSYIESGLAVCSSLNDQNEKHTLIGSYAPASDSVAIIDILKKQ